MSAARTWNRTRRAALVWQLQDREQPGAIMADQTSLRFIGLAFGAITAVITLMAAIAVMNVDRGLEPASPSAVLSTSTG